MTELTQVHKDDYGMQAPFRFGEKYQDGVPYEARDGGRVCCEYCGSLHPREVVALLKAGAGIHLADLKYGWPHKCYLENPWGKFYTKHLQDATAEEKDLIEQKLGLHIDFEQATGVVTWRRYGMPAKHG